MLHLRASIGYTKNGQAPHRQLCQAIDLQSSGLVQIRDPAVQLIRMEKLKILS